MKNMILVIYVLKFINMMHGTKKMKKSKSQPEETTAEGVRLIPQKRTVQNESDDTTKSVITPMPALEGDEKEEKKKEKDSKY